MFIGVSSLALLLLVEYFFPRIPEALIAVVNGIAMVSLFGLEEQGVHVVGDIPLGIARPSCPA